MAGGKKSEGTTRREFLAEAGAALAFGVVSGLAVKAGAELIDESGTQVASRIEHNPSFCAGCSVCALMCSLYHEGETNLSLSRNGIIRDPFEGSYSMEVCRQCLSPSCYEACPQKDYALCIDKETGVKYVNSDKCLGCGECTRACPMKTPGIKLNQESRVSFKCDLCRGRDKGPLCVEYCGQKALTIALNKREG